MLSEKQENKCLLEAGKTATMNIEKRAVYHE